MNKKKKEKLKFLGFSPDWGKSFWKYPRMLEGYWYMLSGSEQKILDFILRQTIGFHKDSDKISLSQFQKGIGKLNKGTGLSKGSIVSGIKGLVDKRFICVNKINYRVNEYGLVVQDLDKRAVQNLNKSGSILEQGGSNFKQKSGLKLKHTIDNNNIKDTKEEIDKIFSLYKENICPDSKLTKEGKKQIAERLKEFTLCELEKAITNFTGNNWWMENNSGNGVKWFFKTADQVDRFLNLPPSPEDKKEVLRHSKYN